MREREQFIFWGTILVICVAILCAVALNPIHKNNLEKMRKIEYKFQDTLEFRDNDTDRIIKKLDNVEFRVLHKSTYGYVVKTDQESPEILVIDDFPPNSYLRYYQTNE